MLAMVFGLCRVSHGHGPLIGTLSVFRAGSAEAQRSVGSGEKELGHSSGEDSKPLPKHLSGVLTRIQPPLAEDVGLSPRQGGCWGFESFPSGG